MKKSDFPTIKRRPIFLYEEKLTQKELAKRACDYVEYMTIKNYSDITIKNHSRNIGLFIEWCEERGLETLIDVSRAVIERYQKYLFHFRKKNNEALSFKTQKLRLINLRVFFSWACRKHHLIYNPAFDLDLPATPKSLPRDVMTQSEVEKVLSMTDVNTDLGIRDRAILEILYSTGIRRLEIVNIRYTDINKEQGILFIKEGKGKKDRFVPIGRRALDWIDKYLYEVRPKLNILNSENKELFLTHTGGCFTPDIMSYVVGKYIKKSKIEKSGGCHMFRHTFATILHNSGVDIRFIQAMLGHENLETTQIYTRVAIHKLKELHDIHHPARSERTKDGLND